jgi:hypothetical protein
MIKSSDLSKIQRLAQDGILNDLMASFISWLCVYFDRPEGCNLQQIQLRFRESYSHETLHKRSPDIYAQLMLGAKVFSEFCLENKILDQTEVERFLKSSSESITETINLQTEYQKDADPVSISIELLQSAIVSKRAFIADSISDGHPTQCEYWGWDSISDRNYKGERIGWLSGRELWLEPNLTYTIVQRMAREQQINFPLSKQGWIKALASSGKILTSTAPGDTRNLIKRETPSGRIRVLVIPESTILLDKPEIWEQKNGSVAPIAPAIQNPYTPAGELLKRLN